MTNEPTSNPVSAAVAAPAKDMSALYTPIAIVVAGALIGGALYMSLSPRSAAVGGPGTPPAPIAVDIKNVETDDLPYIGKANAPLTMAYWSDYQCPFCKRFEVDVMPTLVKDYVDTGKLKIVFMDFAFLGPDSTAAAHYKHAMWELYPAKFFEWNEAMYKAQDQEHGGFGNEASILKLAASIPGVDTAKLKARVASKSTDYDKIMAANQAEAAKVGIQGTPGFVIGKQSIEGAQPLPQFIAAIEAQLK